MSRPARKWNAQAAQSFGCYMAMIDNESNVGLDDDHESEPRLDPAWRQSSSTEKHVAGVCHVCGNPARHGPNIYTCGRCFAALARTIRNGMKARN